METMEADERSPSSSLIERLCARPYGYNLFQAISLLERTQPHLTAVGTLEGQPCSVRLSSVVSLGFQGSDVSKVTFSQQPTATYHLSTGVMSIAGAQGPLPMPFTEMVIARTAVKDFATADFLDIFNNRFLAFLYRGRKKHNMGLNWQPPQSSATAACLDYLSSLGLKAGLHAPAGEVAWLRHAGLLGGAPRSMSGLLALIADRFGVAVNGTQFCGDWRHLELRDIVPLAGAGKGPRLGSSALLGRRVWDQSAGISLQFCALSFSRMIAFLPGGRDHALLAWLVGRYLPQDVTVDVVLELDRRESRPLVLRRSDEVRLGWTSWLSSSAADRKPLPPARFTLNPVVEPLVTT